MINFLLGVFGVWYLVFSVWCTVYGPNTYGSKNTASKQANKTLQES
jgi:hypothetical protein